MGKATKTRVIRINVLSNPKKKGKWSFHLICELSFVEEICCVLELALSDVLHKDSIIMVEDLSQNLISSLSIRSLTLIIEN